ncbi:hypothetical protein ACHAPQ_006765 [Fusarium lateritium]
MPSRTEAIESMEKLDATIIHLQNKLARRNAEYSTLVAQVRQSRAKGMTEKEERRLNQRMRELSCQIRTIERRFDHLWDKKLYLRQFSNQEGGN